MSRPLPLFNPKEKRKKKGTKLCERQLGGEYTYTHTLRRGVGEWINNLGSQWSSFEFCVVIRSVGREKQNHNIRMCARKNRKQPNGKKIETREWWAFLLLLLKKKQKTKFTIQKFTWKKKLKKKNSHHDFKSRARARLFLVPTAVTPQKLSCRMFSHKTLAVPQGNLIKSLNTWREWPRVCLPSELFFPKLSHSKYYISNDSFIVWRVESRWHRLRRVHCASAQQQHEM